MAWNIISIICIIQIGLYVYFRQKKKNLKPLNSNECSGIEVFKLTRSSSMCSACLSKRECDSNSCSFYAQRRIISLLESAQSTIDLCMYSITSKNLGDAVLKAFSKGVKVRLITDAESSFSPGSQIRDFRNQAIPVRIKRSETLMHHKFVIVDRNVLITGSCNWTSLSFLGNWDNFLIISEPAVVKKFTCEFDELFKTFSQAHKQ